MRREGLVARKKRRFRVTTQSNHSEPVARNVLARNFDARKLNRAWAGDITYLPTAQGWLYLAVLLDLCSKAVVGWAMSENLDRSEERRVGKGGRYRWRQAHLKRKTRV